MAFIPHVVPQLRVDTPLRSHFCGDASVAVVLGINSHGQINPADRQERTKLLLDIRGRSGAPTSESQGPLSTTLTQLSRAYRKFDADFAQLPRPMVLPPMATVISSDSDIWARRLTPALDRGASILLLVSYDKVNAYGHDLSGQPGPPVNEVGFPPCRGPHWVVIHGLFMEDGKQHVQWVDPLRDGRRQLLKGIATVPMSFVRGASNALGRVQAGISFAPKPPTGDGGAPSAALAAYARRILAIPRPEDA